ncbi:hypothetical protein P20652_4138 [Pseudoalteromonas sp. BSi20652]|nr:hypothetical protein P20652_4138 [Pseudoalteromonas sp. BSi20652]
MNQFKLIYLLSIIMRRVLRLGWHFFHKKVDNFIVPLVIDVE